jgi:phenylalanyl-tRNA synthetase alpha subunit
MNYGEKLKEQETKLLGLKATVLAKKQSLSEALEKKKKIEEEVRKELGIELNELPSYKTKIEQELAQLSKSLEEDINSIQNELNSIK